MTPDYRISDNPAWQPYRDPTTGEIVTLTPAQCAAVRHAFSVYSAVIQTEIAKGSNPNPAFDPAGVYGLSTVTKSCLMGRLLHDGKAPLVDAPPVAHAAPDYSVEVPADIGDGAG